MCIYYVLFFVNDNSYIKKVCQITAANNNNIFEKEGSKFLTSNLSPKGFWPTYKDKSKK